MIDGFLFYTSILKKAFRQHAQEISYFLRAKKRYIRDGYLKNNPALFLRKKTHHLERCLFAPHLYSSDTAENAAKEIEKILTEGKELPLEQRKWAQKILQEYKTGIRQNTSVFCPMLINNTARKQPQVTAENLMSLIRQRRSRRIFIDTPLTDSEKTAICQAAQYAPSSCNRQTLYLIFVEERELKDFIASTIPGGHQFFAQAPCILLLLSDAGDFRYPEDRMVPFAEGAAAVQNIYLLCETMGLGCCWGSYTSFGSVDREKEVRNRLKIPDTHLIVASLAIGKSNQFVCEIPRDLPENRFGNNCYGNK
ncbi:MAG: nitroreductase family protein [Phycisphaerae bacterium]|nr:nitroreductase family protein [Phycisphaerae bacterium]